MYNDNNNKTSVQQINLTTHSMCPCMAAKWRGVLFSSFLKSKCSTFSLKFSLSSFSSCSVCSLSLATGSFTSMDSSLGIFAAPLGEAWRSRSAKRVTRSYISEKLHNMKLSTMQFYEIRYMWKKVNVPQKGGKYEPVNSYTRMHVCTAVHIYLYTYLPTVSNMYARPCIHHILICTTIARTELKKCC